MTGDVHHANLHLKMTYSSKNASLLKVSVRNKTLIEFAEKLSSVAEEIYRCKLTIGSKNSIILAHEMSVLLTNRLEGLECAPASLGTAVVPPAVGQLQMYVWTE